MHSILTSGLLAVSDDPRKIVLHLLTKQSNITTAYINARAICSAHLRVYDSRWRGAEKVRLAGYFYTTKQ